MKKLKGPVGIVFSYIFLIFVSVNCFCDEPDPKDDNLASTCFHHTYLVIVHPKELNLKDAPFISYDEEVLQSFTYYTQIREHWYQMKFVKHAELCPCEN